jgi:hypothetical protein
LVTSSSPFSSIVLSESCRQERGPCYGFDGFAKFVDKARKLFQAFLFLPPGRSLFFAPLPFFGVHLGG